MLNYIPLIYMPVFFPIPTCIFKKDYNVILQTAVYQKKKKINMFNNEQIQRKTQTNKTNCYGLNVCVPQNSYIETESPL